MKSKILVRYLIRQNLFYLALVFGAGLSIYFLIELFDRLDDFLKAGVGADVIVLYFFAKTPLIISQIFPAVFLLSLIIQFSLMHRNREIVALQACAVSFLEIGRTVLLYALVWACLLFAFSQVVGTKGYSVANRIWKEDVRKKQAATQILRNVWFREGRYVVTIRSCQPFQGKGTGVVVYTLAENSRTLERIVTAQSVDIQEGRWRLHGAEVVTPATFSREKKDLFELRLRTNPKEFVTLKNDKAPQYISFWDLANVIQGLDAAGSNVENLRTALHVKVSYPFSLVIMALVAIVLTMTFSNIYRCVVAGLLIIFVYYALFVIGSSAGETGTLTPALAAWMANFVFGCVFGGGMLVSFLRKP